MDLLGRRIRNPDKNFRSNYYVKSIKAWKRKKEKKEKISLVKRAADKTSRITGEDKRKWKRPPTIYNITRSFVLNMKIFVYWNTGYVKSTTISQIL